MWQVVFHAKHHAKAYEPRMWCGEENSVQILLQKVSTQMEPGAAHKTVASQRKEKTPDAATPEA